MALHRSHSMSEIRGGNWLVLTGWLAGCFAASALGAFFMPGDWYAQLNKPSWNPPSWIFGPVWTLLYVMMGVAAWQVWKRGGFASQRRPLGLFLLQLALNAAWTPLFFGLRQPGIAFAEIVLLWVTLLATIISFHRVHKPAAGLLLPYLAWVTFASALNFTLWRLNP
jgi:translocator protein